jgi:hypothetical protein
MITEAAALKCADIVRTESLKHPEILANSPTAVALIRLAALLRKADEQILARDAGMETDIAMRDAERKAMSANLLVSPGKA